MRPPRAHPVSFIRNEFFSEKHSGRLIKTRTTRRILGSRLFMRFHVFALNAYTVTCIQSDTYLCGTGAHRVPIRPARTYVSPFTTICIRIENTALNLHGALRSLLIRSNISIESHELNKIESNTNETRAASE